MKYLIFLSLLLLSCQPIKKLEQPQKNSLAPEPTYSPSSCRFKGRIINITSDKDAANGSVCHQYPCIANVAVLEVQVCGSSVTEPLMVGDVMRMRFAYSTAPSALAFPTLKNKYPGLKAGDVFVANIQQRLSVGDGLKFVVYDYTVQ